jgi:hypothetical protein
VEHKNGTETRELTPLKKSIYSLIDLREILLGCNRRYLIEVDTLFKVKVISLIFDYLADTGIA